MILDFSYEKNMRRKGHRIVAYVDEVGVGPLAGPVAVCAVSCKRLFPSFIRTLNLNDSKKLTSKRREELYELFTSMPNLFWAVSFVSPKVIDGINIRNAVLRAGKRAVLTLEKKIGQQVDYIVLDGNLKLPLERKQTSFPKADENVALCAIASILAKVTRDRTMLRYHTKYPQYRFDLHKGYGTKLHYEMLEKSGLSPIHRATFVH